MENAVAGAIRQKRLQADFPPTAIVNLLMKIDRANLREYRFDKSDLDTFRNTTVFEFGFTLANAAADASRRNLAGIGGGTRWWDRSRPRSAGLETSSG